MKKRIFISDRECGKSIEKILYCINKEIKTKIDIIINREYPLKIPADFETYVLHLSEIHEENLKELREKQQWSWIYGSSGAIGNIPISIKENLDRIFYVISKDNAEYILNEIKDYRKKKC